MYAGKIGSIDIPKDLREGRIFSQKNGYLYYVSKSQWDSEKKRTVDNRVCIGKVDPSNSDKMFPNQRYEEFFGPIDATVAALKEFYDPKLRREAGRFHYSLSYGSYVVLKQCAEKCGLLNALERAMPLYSQRIFSVALHAIIAERSTAQNFLTWIFDNYCGFDIPSSDSSISRLYREIANNHESQAIFFELFRDNFHSIFPKSKEMVCAFDSTNQVTECKNITDAKLGKSKSGVKLPIINTAIYTDEETEISIWYEHFSGNVLDKTQTPYSVEKANQLGYNKIFLMMDRGYYSFDNMKSVSDLGIGFGVMLPETLEVVTETIRGFRDKLKLNEKYYINDYDIYGLDTIISIQNGRESADYHAFIYYDDNTAKDERDLVHMNVNYFLSQAMNRKRYSKKMSEYFKPRAIIVKESTYQKETGQNFVLEINHEMVKEAYQDTGFFIVISNRAMSAENMIRIVRGRDTAEKAFMYLKSHFDLERAKTHNEFTYSGKMFVAFVALVILQSFKWFTRSLLTKSRSETISTLIGELNRYKIQQKKDGSWFPVYAMNKNQKDILKCVGLTEDIVENSVRNIRIRDSRKKSIYNHK